MTVSTINSIAEFATNGVTTNFPFYFKFLANEDLVVTYVNPLGVSTTLTLGTNYTVNGAGDEDGGSITTTSALAGPGQLAIAREMDAYQLTSLRNQGKFLAETHEDVFDKLTMLIQQGFSIFKRALTRPFGRDYFDAENRRIANVADPTESQDAVTRNWVGAYIDSVSGLINNTLGIAYDGVTLFDYLRFGVERSVDSISALRLLSSTRNQRAFVRGYYAKGDRGGGHYHVDQADVTSADNGGSIIVAADGARWKLIHDGTIKPEQFGARANGTDDWAFITAAISFIRSLGGGVLDLGRGGKSFQVGKPVRLYSNMRITGRAFIIARTGFVADVSFPTFGTLDPQIYNTIAYFNDGAFADDPGNSGYSGLEIDAGVVFYGNYQCDNGLIMEGITNYRISGRFQAFNSVGVWAKYYCWGGRINAYISDCLFAMLKLGEAANGIDLNGLQLFGNANNPTYALQIVGDNNGINLAGAFVEKCINGILWTGNSGPSSIAGVDFEDCFGTLIKVDGTGLIGRAAGPITITGSFMEATTIGVHAINAIVVVTGCRMRDTQFGFVTSGPLARIYRTANVIESTVVTVDSGNVIADSVASRRRQMANRLPNDQLSSVEGFAIENYFYSFNEAAKVSNLSFDSVVVDVPTQRMLSTSTWETREMRAGSAFGVCGIKLDYSAGLRTVVPRGDNDHSLGTVALRWSVLCAATGTINTSDARLKTPVSRLSENQIAASIELGKEIGTYKWLDAMAEKGDGARSHIGMTVQRAIEILEKHGLDPMDCAFICYDKWEAKEAVLNDQGEITEPACEADDRYGFRFDQLLAFIAAGFESRLSALEAK